MQDYKRHFPVPVVYFLSKDHYNEEFILGYDKCQFIRFYTGEIDRKRYIKAERILCDLDQSKRWVIRDVSRCQAHADKLYFFKGLLLDRPTISRITMMPNVQVAVEKPLDKEDQWIKKNTKEHATGEFEWDPILRQLEIEGYIYTTVEEDPVRGKLIFINRIGSTQGTISINLVLKGTDETSKNVREMLKHLYLLGPPAPDAFPRKSRNL